MASVDWRSRVHPELRANYSQLPNLTFGPWTSRLFRMVERSLLPTVRVPDGVEFREASVGEQRIRLFWPTDGLRAPAAVLWLHGGGRVMGSPRSMDRHCIRATRSLGILNATASYRLAPEHPSPAGLDDCARPFLDEDTANVERLRACGVEAVLHPVVGGFHGFFTFGEREPAVVDVWSSLEAFLRSQLHIGS